MKMHNEAGINIIDLRHSKTFDENLSNGFKYDSKFWLNNIEKYDGKAIILNNPVIYIPVWATDACRYTNKSGQTIFAGIGSFFMVKL